MSREDARDGVRAGRARGARSACVEGCGVEPVTREARHTFTSLMIAPGVNAKALATYMGHASVAITYDRYWHLMPGNEDEAAALFDAYLERSNHSRSRRLRGGTNEVDERSRVRAARPTAPG